MAHGITQDMIKFSHQMEWRKPKSREKRERDRTLSGKSRRRARKVTRR